MSPFDGQEMRSSAGAAAATDTIRTQAGWWGFATISAFLSLVTLTYDL